MLSKKGFILEDLLCKYCDLLKWKLPFWIIVILPVLWLQQLFYLQDTQVLGGSAGGTFLSKLAFLMHGRIKPLAFVTWKLLQSVYIMYPRKSGCSLAQISGKSEVREALIQTEGSTTPGQGICASGLFISPDETGLLRVTLSWSKWGTCEWDLDIRLAPRKGTFKEWEALGLKGVNVCEKSGEAGVRIGWRNQLW